MEVPRGYVSTIEVPVPVNEEVTASVTRENATYAVTTTAVNNVARIQLPYASTHAEGTLKVVVSFTVDDIVYMRNASVNVVTPYVEIHEMRKVLGAEATDDECWSAEAASRHMINSHTGREFGRFEGTIPVLANGDTALPLPQRLIRLDRLYEGSTLRVDKDIPSGTTYLGDGTYEITGSGMFLKKTAYRSPEWAEWYSSDPITVPTQYDRTNFKNDTTYTISGLFGYESVPSAVAESARLLAEDFSCNDASYRNKYIESIKTADWRIQYNSGAYRRTGNALVDKLLSPYVIFRAKVI